MTDSIDLVRLETERLRLRPLRPGDAGLLALYAGDARVARMTTSIPHPYPPGLAEAFIEKTLAGGARVWAIDHRHSTEGEFVGLITLRADGEIGYWVGAPFWSTGFATEAVEAVVAAAPALGHDILRAKVFQDNAASARVLVKAGFAYVGDGESYSVSRGAMVPDWRYRLAPG